MLGVGVGRYALPTHAGDELSAVLGVTDGVIMPRKDGDNEHLLRSRVKQVCELLFSCTVDVAMYSAVPSAIGGGTDSV